MKYLYTFTFVLLLCFAANAQNTFISGGWSFSRLEESYVNSPQGTNISLGYEFHLFESQFKLINNVDVAFLFSDLDSEFLPAYGNIVSLSPKVAYEFQLFNRFKILPFFGPFVAWDVGLEANNLPLLAETEVRNRHRYGFDTGLAIDFMLMKGINLRFVPWRLQYGNDFFRHGLMQIGIGF